MLLHMMIMYMFTIPLTKIALGTLQASNSTSMNNKIAKPGCPTKCGDVTIPYPFGIGSDCSLNEVFNLTCNASSSSSELLITRYYHRVRNISDSHVRMFSRVSYICYQQNTNISYSSKIKDLEFYLGSERILTFSEKNKFTVIGCDDFATLSGNFEGYRTYSSTGCAPGTCDKDRKVLLEGSCSGDSQGCCQTSITKGLRYYTVTLNSNDNHSKIWSFNKCGYAFLGEEGSFEFHGSRDLSNANSEVVKRIESTVPVLLDWVIAPDGNCSNATECKQNSECYDVNGGGYRCRCKKGFEGVNPYLEAGCLDINECEDPKIQRICKDGCVNTSGSYYCSAPKSKNIPVVFILIGVLLGTGILVLAVSMYKVVQKRKDKKHRKKFFKRNGGLLLQQQTSNGEDAIQRTRMFSAKELEKATDQYNRNRIVGRGGQGTVYKGMLPDGKIVAVKKSMLVDETQVESFINEVFLLSQISHRNVVKLLGCCLETEVPILVYEFVSNGDLYHFIHDENYEFPTLWSIRLIIATEVAGALAYMHSATSIPIYHRDIKSSNILLDEKFRAKLSDFGISKSVMGDQTHLSTLVKGTYGYLDPEYFQSNQFTEKSDVYSFGIVLVELLTGKKPIYSIGPGESRSLATLILSMEEGLILENIDDRVSSDGPKEQFIAVSRLAKRCLNLNGKLRPTMKEVATELEGIRSTELEGERSASHSKPIRSDIFRKLGKRSNWVGEDNYNETSSLNIEMEPTDLYTVPLMSDTFGESSVTSEMQDMMLELKSAR